MERVLKQNSKLFWVVILVLAMCIGLAFSSKLNLNPKAEETTTGTYGDFTYKVENGEVIITKYTGEKNAEVSIPETIGGMPVTEIGEYAFEGAGYLKKVVFGEHSNLKRIGQRAFYNCSLMDLYLPDTVTLIGSYAFFNNTLYNVKLPKNLEQIKDNAFVNNKTRRIYVPNFAKDIQITGYIWSHYGDGSDNVHTSFHPEYSTVAVFEEGITKIPDNMFSGLRTLAWAEIPNSVTSIGSRAFANISNGKSTIVIPNSVTFIGNDAFAESIWPNRKPTIRCYEGSYAETYAKENGFPSACIEIWDGATTFEHPSAFKDANKYAKDTHDICYYSDSYFSNGDDMQGSYGYKPSLATMSMALAWSTFSDETKIGSFGYQYTNQNAKDLLTNIGMVDIEANGDYSKKPTSDSIGVICGNKPIYQDGKQYTLIACAVRGGGYEQEWSSNFAIGTENQHQGFKDSADKVLNYLASYITKTDYHITGPIKLWITGYSRAAAVSNLLAGYIDEVKVPFGADITYDLKDVYTYTFETPAGALQKDVKKDRYGNIYNIINPADPVPYVAPATLDFGRYGIDMYLPAKGVNSDYWASKAKMKKIYDNMFSEKEASNSSDYVPKYELVDKFVMKKIKMIVPTAVNKDGIKWEAIVETDHKHMNSQPVFLSEFVTALANDKMISRENYVESYQDEIRLLSEIVYSIPKQNMPTVKDTFMEHLKEEWSLVVALCLSEKLTLGVADVRGAVEGIVSEWVVDSIRAAGLRPENYKTKEAVKTIAHLAVDFVFAHPNYTTSAVMYAKGLGSAHYPQLCYAWVASMDKNYNPDAEVSYHIFDYRKVRINCDVDVSVYDSNNTLVAQIINETPTDLDNDYIYGIDDDGQKYVLLPIDEDYTIDIKAYNDTTVNYGISEYSAKAGAYTRDVNYFDIALDKNESLTGEISSYLPEEVETDTMQASHATYTITDSNDDLIKPTSDLKDDDSINASYNVDVKTSDEEQGIVLGSGTHQFGQFAKLEAVAKEGYRFVGWFIDGDLVSTETSYRIRVEKDVEVVGKFTEKTTEPTDPTNPTEPTDPTEPTEPTDPIVPDKPDVNNDLDTSVNGIVQCPDGRWAMYKNGKVDTTCTTIAQNKYGWWRVENGYVNFEAQSIYQNKFGWWKTTNGKVTFLEFGLFENENGTWRVENSRVNFLANGIYKGKDGWYKTTDGKVTFKENGVFQNQFGWWYVKDSKVDFDYTGIASNKFGKWYINKGKVDFTKVGFIKDDGKSVMVMFGKVLFG